MRHAHEGQQARAIELVRHARHKNFVRFLFPNHIALGVQHLHSMRLEPLGQGRADAVPQRQLLDGHFRAEIHFPPRIIFLRGVRHGFFFEIAVRVAVVAVFRRTAKRRAALRCLAFWRDIFAIAENLHLGEMEKNIVAQIGDAHETAVEIFFAFRAELQREAFVELTHAGHLQARDSLRHRFCQKAFAREDLRLERGDDHRFFKYRRPRWKAIQRCGLE